MGPRARCTAVAGTSGNSTIGVTDSGDRPKDSMPSWPRRAAGLRRRSCRPAMCSVASSAARASSQACTDDGIALAPLGDTRTLPNVATASWAAANAAGRVHRGRERQHRVVPIGQPGGAGVVRLAAEREVPAPVRPDGDATATGRVDEIERPALLDVQFDEDADAVRPGAGRRRAASGSAPAPGSSPRPSVTPSTSRSPRAWSALRAPVDNCEPMQATPNRAPSSSENATTADRDAAGDTPRSRSDVDRGERGHRRRAARRTRRRRAPSPGANRSRTALRGSPVHPAASTTPTGCRCGPPRRPCRAERRSPANHSRKRQVGVATRRSGGSRRSPCPGRRRESIGHSGVERGHAFISCIGIRTPRSAATSPACS